MTKEEFLKDTENWNNHKYLLWEALQLTAGSQKPVIEFGAGDGSTPYLRKYCADNNRAFISYESDKEWAEKCGSIYVPNWHNANVYKHCSVLLVDEAPGEHRHQAMAIMMYMAGIIVVHDSEEGGSGQYFFDKVWRLFKWRINVNKTGGGAGASAVSNNIDLSHLLNATAGPYIIEP